MYQIPTCGENCEHDLPPVYFDDCEPAIHASEIQEILIALAGEDDLSDWTDSSEWAYKINAGNILVLSVIGDKPAPNELSFTISKKRKAVINRAHALNFDIDETNNVNYEAMRQIQCGGFYKIWYKTEGNQLYGGNTGVVVSIEANDALSRGDEIEKFQFTATWKNKFDPPRTEDPRDNPIDTGLIQWVSVADDPYVGLLTADALAYTGSYTLPYLGANGILDVHAHPDNYYLVVRFPERFTTKTKFDETGTANISVSIPGVQFPHSFTARGFKYLVSGDVVFNPDPAARVTLHN